MGVDRRWLRQQPRRASLRRRRPRITGGLLAASGLTFDLPALPAGATIVSAQLRIRQTRVDGDAPFGALLQRIVAEHARYTSTWEADEVPAISGTIDQRLVSDGPALGWRSVPVTEAVLYELAHSRSRVQLRLRFVPQMTDADSQVDFVTFSSNNEPPPNEWKRPWLSTAPGLELRPSRKISRARRETAHALRRVFSVWDSVAAARALQRGEVMRASTLLPITTLFLALVSTEAMADNKGPPVFDPSKLTIFDAKITAVDVHWNTGVVLTVVTAIGEKRTVHLGPEWVLAEQSFTFAKGDQIVVTGSRIERKGRILVIASQIEKDGRTLKLRDRAGTPLWEGGAQPGA